MIIKNAHTNLEKMLDIPIILINAYVKVYVSITFSNNIYANSIMIMQLSIIKQHNMAYSKFGA